MRCRLLAWLAVTTVACTPVEAPQAPPSVSLPGPAPAPPPEPATASAAPIPPPPAPAAPEPAIPDAELVRAGAASPAIASARLALGDGAELVVAVRPGESSGHEPLIAAAIVEGG